MRLPVLQTNTFDSAVSTLTDLCPIGGGLWHPEAAPTAAMRTDIDRNPKKLKDVLNESKLRTEFLGGAKDSKKALKAFMQENAGNALKTRPKVCVLLSVLLSVLLLHRYSLLPFKGKHYLLLLFPPMYSYPIGPAARKVLA